MTNERSMQSNESIDATLMQVKAELDAKLEKALPGLLDCNIVTESAAYANCMQKLIDDKYCNALRSIIRSFKFDVCSDGASIVSHRFSDIRIKLSDLQQHDMLYNKEDILQQDIRAFGLQSSICIKLMHGFCNENVTVNDIMQLTVHELKKKCKQLTKDDVCVIACKLAVAGCKLKAENGK